MKIAVLAWGSLIWDRRELAIRNDFVPNGPHLPIEFCRVSGDGRLTLVIDESLGASCLTYSALSGFDDLDAAIENLRIREGMPGVNGVGFVDVASGNRSERAIKHHPQAVAAIKVWAQATDYDAVIWTALACNFHDADKAGKPFSIETALGYLETLDASKLSAASVYIRSAPPEVRTPVRAAVTARWPEG